MLHRRLLLGQRQRVGKHGVHRLRRHEAQGRADGLIDLLQILLVLLGDDDGPDAAAFGGHGLLLQPADGQHPSPQRDLAGHGHIVAHRPVRQGRQHGRGDGDARRRPILGHGPLGEVDMDVLRLVKVSGDAQLRRAAA